MAITIAAIHLASSVQVSCEFSPYKAGQSSVSLWGTLLDALARSVDRSRVLLRSPFLESFLAYERGWYFPRAPQKLAVVLRAI